MNTIGLPVLLLLAASPVLADDFPPKFELQSAPDVWITVDQADTAAAEFPLAPAVLSEGGVSVFKVRPEMLPLLSGFMHDNFNRCGGYFAHDSRAAAQASMRPAAAAPRVQYMLDQQATVKPLAAAVDEAGIRATISALAAFNNRYYQSETGVEASRWIKDRWSELAAKVPGASAALFPHASWKQPSVILTIPGSEKPEEIVVLGGHLDSIAGWGGGSSARAPGADDNASGIAVLTETARLLAESGWRPKRTVQFMGYAAEEVGLRGSQDIAARYAAEGRKVVGVIQFDMSNFAGSGPGIFMLTDHVDSALSDFTARLAEAYAGAPVSKTKCGYACSDHASWTKKGFASAMAFESTFDGSNKAIHSDKDTLATSGGTAAHSVPFARLAVAFAVELAKTANSSPAALARN